MRQVCGLDVHKDSVFVCILNEKEIVFQDKFGVLTTELEKMLGLLKQYDVGEVCMESTSVYWIPVWRVLEDYIPTLKLVNPHFIKQLPGRKSDVQDAEWIATCLLKDLIKGSYIPEDRIQQLRLSMHFSVICASRFLAVITPLVAYPLRSAPGGGVRRCRPFRWLKRPRLQNLNALFRYLCIEIPC